MGESRCRCCSARLDPESISFRLTVKETSDGLTLRDKLLECIPEININGKSKDVICVTCFSALTSAYNFRKMCLKTDRKLREREKEEEEEKVTEKEEDVQAIEVREPDIELVCAVSLNTLPEKVVMSSAGGNTIFVCDRCKSLFLRRENYLKHIEEEVDSCGKCVMCHVSFRSNVIYEMHMKFMHSQHYNIYKLKDAHEQVLIKSIEMSADKTQITKKPKIPFPKINLNNVKGSSAIVKRKKRSSINDHLVCIICTKRFPHPYHLVRHFQVHEKYCYRCLDCGRLEVELSLHNIRCKCSSSNFTLPTFTDTRCPFCFKRFESFLELQDHLISHKNFRNYCCSCRITFGTFWEMTLHHIVSKCATSQYLSSFVFQEPFVHCPICTKIFKNKKNLQPHFLNHRLNTIVCSTCEIPFFKEDLYWEHCKSCKNMHDLPMETTHNVEEQEQKTQVRDHIEKVLNVEPNTIIETEKECEEMEQQEVDTTAEHGVDTTPQDTVDAIPQDIADATPQDIADTPPQDISDMIPEDVVDTSLEHPVDIVCVKEEREISSETDESVSNLKDDGTSVMGSPVDEEQITPSDEQQVNGETESENNSLVKEITENFQTIIEKIGKDKLKEITETANSVVDDAETERAVDSITVESVAPEHAAEPETEMVTSTT